ncbi:MAG: hypothetical protein M0009_10735 [Deltaproteobacteria bacterium]|nr:hypothetical protein [Deltaproteobacteria bacterium]
MKKFPLLMLIAAAWILIDSPVAGAWEVSLYNGTSVPVKFEIYGQHLFWEQIDCTQTLEPGKRGVCTMPGAICRSSVQFTFWDKTQTRERVEKVTNVATCFRSWAEVTEDVHGLFDWRTGFVIMY